MQETLRPMKGFGVIMYNVVGIRFKQAGKIYYFDPAGFDLKPGMNAIVETARGIEFGQVMIGPKEVPEEKVTLPLKKVLHIATPEDEKQLHENEDKEKRAFGICLQKIEQHQLEMKLVDVEYTFDRSKIIFYFTADGRVDFRELVKDLATVFRTRIELRQIGVRDEAKRKRPAPVYSVGGPNVCLTCGDPASRSARGSGRRPSCGDSRAARGAC